MYIELDLVVDMIFEPDMYTELDISLDSMDISLDDMDLEAMDIDSDFEAMDVDVNTNLDASDRSFLNPF